MRKLVTVIHYAPFVAPTSVPYPYKQPVTLYPCRVCSADRFSDLALLEGQDGVPPDRLSGFGIAQGVGSGLACLFTSTLYPRKKYFLFFRGASYL